MFRFGPRFVDLVLVLLLSTPFPTLRFPLLPSPSFTASVSSSSVFFFSYFIPNSTNIKLILSHKNKITSHSTQSNKMPLLDPSTPIYHVTIFILLALLGLAVFMGLVYHSWYKGLQKRQYDIQGIQIATAITSGQR